jgi:DNA polymerase-3 subunit alpha
MRDYRTKNGELMCFVDGFDEFGEINMVLMPNVYSRYSSTVRKGCVVFAEGTIDDRLSVKVNNMIILEGGN